jgi:hypothetical protein
MMRCRFLDRPPGPFESLLNGAHRAYCKLLSAFSTAAQAQEKIDQPGNRLDILTEDDLVVEVRENIFHDQIRKMMIVIHQVAENPNRVEPDILVAEAKMLIPVLSQLHSHDRDGSADSYVLHKKVLRDMLIFADTLLQCNVHTEPATRFKMAFLNISWPKAPPESAPYKVEPK